MGKSSPRELFRRRALELDAEQLLSLALTSSIFANLTQDLDFWRDKAIKDFSITIDDFNRARLKSSIVIEKSFIALSRQKFKSRVKSANIEDINAKENNYSASNSRTIRRKSS